MNALFPVIKLSLKSMEAILEVIVRPPQGPVPLTRLVREITSDPKDPVDIVTALQYTGS